MRLLIEHFSCHDYIEFCIDYYNKHMDKTRPQAENMA